MKTSQYLLVIGLLWLIIGNTEEKGSIFSLFSYIIATLSIVSGFIISFRE